MKILSGESFSRRWQDKRRSSNGYRFYNDDTVNLLQFVKRAQSLGTTLKEIKPLLNLASQGQRPCNHAKQSARNPYKKSTIRSVSCRRFAPSFPYFCDVKWTAPTETKFVRLFSAAACRRQLKRLTESSQTHLGNRRRWSRRSILAIRLFNLCSHFLETLALIHHFHHVTRDADADVSAETHTIEYRFFR
jgi:DNA-binding transcriptional MerR regulator